MKRRLKRGRTVAVITGTRSEFGLLEPVMQAIAHSGVNNPASRDRLKLQVVVTGTHLTHGTWRDIRRAGYAIDAKVVMQRRNAVGRHADVAALARGVAGLGKVFAASKPDVVLVLGDRIEALAGALAASVGGIYVAHLHGGDRAAGVADEAMRHAISKLAHLHFPATARSQQRLIRMGEPRERVFCVGSPAAHGLGQLQPAHDAPDLIVVQHPIGASDDDERCWMDQTLAATKGFSRLVMASNSDPGSGGIRRALRSSRVKVIDHLPRAEFLSVLAGAQAIVGNSSAGLIEAAVLGRPCVNVGPRQDGREKPGNVIDCGYGQRSVRVAIRKALSLDLRRMRHPYGDGHTGQRIAHLLSTLDLTEVPTHKRNAY